MTTMFVYVRYAISPLGVNRLFCFFQGRLCLLKGNLISTNVLVPFTVKQELRKGQEF